jgi:hypothetical protein
MPVSLQKFKNDAPHTEEKEIDSMGADGFSFKEFTVRGRTSLIYGRFFF